MPSLSLLVTLLLVGLVGGVLLYRVLLSISSKVIVERDSYVLKKDIYPDAWKKDIGTHLVQSSFIIEQVLPQLMSLAPNTPPSLRASFLPIILTALEKSPVLWESRKQQIEDFFASFPNPEAVPYLLQSLSSSVRVKTDELLNEHSLGRRETTSSYTEDYSYGGSFGDEEGYKHVTQTLEVEDFELTYAYRYPVAEGAKRSLAQISEFGLSSNQRISDALQKYDSEVKESFKTAQTRTIAVKDENVEYEITQHTSCVR